MIVIPTYIGLTALGSLAVAGLGLRPRNVAAQAPVVRTEPHKQAA